MRRFSLAAIVAASLPLALPHAGLAQPAGLVYPRAGIVCDSVGKTCYDSYGPSIGITGEYFGQRAADRLGQNLSGSSSRDFRLSSGQACIVGKRTCYDDGWNQNNVAQGLTNQLFGSSGTRPNQAQVARDSGLCSLTRGGRREFDGPCQLKQVRKGNQNRYEVQLQNGNRYVFRQTGSGFEIQDGFGGTWPVTFVDHGNTGIFRFGDYKLVATQNGGSRQPMSKEEAVGNALGNLLNSLFK